MAQRTDPQRAWKAGASIGLVVRDAVVRNSKAVTDALGAVASEAIMLTGASRLRARRRAAPSPDAVFLWIPKTAGASLSSLIDAQAGLGYLDYHRAKWIFPNTGTVHFGHMRYLDLLADGVVSQDFDRRAYKFCVVRNPYDRAVSLFHYLMKQGHLIDGMRFDWFAELLAQGHFDPIGRYNVRGLSQCNPQISWLCDDEGQLIPDLIGRFEDLDPFLRTLGTRLGITGSMPQLNRSTRRDYRTYYRSTLTRSNIELCYREDLETFGYEF